MVATPVEVGDEVEAGAPVIVLESMKMETVLHAPFAARVRELLVTTGSQVETGAPLRAPGAAAVTSRRPRPRRRRRRPPTSSCRRSGDASAYDRAVRGLDDLRSLLLGFDLDPRDEGAPCPATSPRGPS